MLISILVTSNRVSALHRHIKTDSFCQKKVRNERGKGEKEKRRNIKAQTPCQILKKKHNRDQISGVKSSFPHLA